MSLRVINRQSSSDDGAGPTGRLDEGGEANHGRVVFGRIDEKLAPELELNALHAMSLPLHSAQVCGQTTSERGAFSS